MNLMIITGNICNDLELKSTDSGKSVCSFNLAVKRPYAKDVTDFIKVVCWNNQAENVCKYCYKGMRIGVTGALTSRTYQDKDKNNRTVYELVANDVEFLEEKAADSTSNTLGTDTVGFVVAQDDDTPF